MAVQGVQERDTREGNKPAARISHPQPRQRLYHVADEAGGQKRHAHELREAAALRGRRRAPGLRLEPRRERDDDGVLVVDCFVGVVGCRVCDWDLNGV